ncbi:hypothetical protein LXL04_023533 [Taraxacum kok-saghyz]
METPKETMDSVTCSFTSDNFDEIIENFKICPTLQLMIPAPNQTIKTPPEGFVGIYHQFLKAGLRFPVFTFLKTVLQHYNLHIAQLAPNSFRKIISFVMLSWALGVVPSLTLFRHFFVTLVTGDWVTFTRRQGLDDICDGLPTSIKRWKPEFLFISDKEFSADMIFGEFKNRAVDHPPELTAEQKVLADQMVVNVVKWSNPDEVMLGMAGLSTYWTSLEVLEGPISGFFRPSVVDTALEEESSMDSATVGDSAGENTSATAKVLCRGLKPDRAAAHPPFHPSRAIKETSALKKRGSSSATGGSSSPDSEKGSPAPEEKDTSIIKRRRLLRGGNHPDKASDPICVPATSASDLAQTSVPISSVVDLFECHVSTDPLLAGATIASETSAVPFVDFLSSGLSSDASLVSSIKTLSPPVSEKVSMTKSTVSPPPLVKPMVVKKSMSAFHQTLLGAGLGFSKFAKAVVSSPEAIAVSEKQLEASSGEMKIRSSAAQPADAVLSIPPLPSSPEGVTSTAVLTVPLEAIVLGNEASCPTLVSLTAALPAFMHPYSPSGIAKPSGLGKLSEEEGLDRARTRAANLAAQKAEFDRVSALVDETNKMQARLTEEKTKLLQGYQQMELRNQELVMELDGLRDKQKELSELNRSVQEQLEVTQRYREADLKGLEEAGQQFESLKVLFSEKVYGFEILCNQKEVILKRQEMELKGSNKGVASCVRDVLNSQEFGNLNALCQGASIQIGLTQACLEMKDKYPVLANEPLLYSYPTSQDVLLDRFMEATGYEYHLLRMLKAGSMDVGSLKKFLEENENGGSSQALEDKSSEVELLIVEEQLKVPDGKIIGEAKQAAVTDMHVGAQVLGGEGAAADGDVSVGDGDGKGDGVMGSDVENLVSPNVETVGTLSYIKAGLKIALFVMDELTVPGRMISGLVITGLAIAGFAVAELARTGLAIAGFAIAGFAVAELVRTRLAIAGFAIAGIVWFVRC